MKNSLLILSLLLPLAIGQYRVLTRNNQFSNNNQNNNLNNLNNPNNYNNNLNQVDDTPRYGRPSLGGSGLGSGNNFATPQNYGQVGVAKSYRNSYPNFVVDPQQCLNDKDQIRSPDAPPLTPKNTWSEGIRVGDLLFVSGKLPTTWPNFDLVADRSLDSQIQKTFDNIADVVEAAGGCLDDTVKLTIFINEASGFTFDDTARAMSRGIERNFSPPYPARSTVGVTRIGEANAALEIEAVVDLKASRRLGGRYTTRINGK